jgi:hypothetical protein
VKTTKLLLMLSFGSFLFAGCDYRVFDIAEYPELSGVFKDPSKLIDKPTVESFNSIFETVIKPKCLICHSAGGKAEDYPFETYNDLVSGSDPLIIPGYPEESIFYLVMLPKGRPLMPPKKSGLSLVDPALTDVIRSWIANGAVETIR